MGADRAHFALALLKVILNIFDSINVVRIFCIQFKVGQREFRGLIDFLHASWRSRVNTGKVKVLKNGSAWGPQGMAQSYKL